MAKSITSEEVTAKHNVTGRRQAYDEAVKRTYELDQEIAALTEEHLSELRQEKRDIKAKLYEDFNVTASAFNARYYAYKFERKARDAGDTASLDTLRELFEATPVGGQLDFVDAMAAQEAKPAENPKAKGGGKKGNGNGGGVTGEQLGEHLAQSEPWPGKLDEEGDEQKRRRKRDEAPAPAAAE